MSEPDGRYAAPHGSSASPGAPLPGQPLADQPTEVVEPVQRHDRQDTVVGMAPVYPAPRTGDTGAPSRQWDDVRHDAPRGNRTDDDGASTRPEYRDAPVVVRRADSVAGLLLLLAGIAAGISLLVVWIHGGGTGLDLLRDGVDDLGDPQRLADRGTWEPLAVVYGGVALFVLGLLLFIPAKTHRLLGVLALLVALVVAAGVLVPLADAQWDLQRWAVGAWFTVAVGGLGFLGALKALMTGPKVGRRH
ncbi:MAG: conserved rane protein of unknown function [Modestobacter sp.]|nr:conserved rane protein of unknown function [Modestobacter sp.]